MAVDWSGTGSELRVSPPWASQRGAHQAWFDESDASSEGSTDTNSTLADSDSDSDATGETSPVTILPGVSYTSIQVPASLSASSFPARCTRSITLAKCSGYSQRLRISGVYGVVGGVLFSVGLVLYLWPWTPWWLGAIAEAVWQWGLVILSLAVLPTDRRLIYAMTMVWIATFSLQCVDMLWFGKRSVAYFSWKLSNDNLYANRDYDLAHLLCKVGMGMSSGSLALVLVRCAVVLYPRDLLEHCWKVLWAYAVAYMLLDTIKVFSAWFLLPTEDADARASQLWETLSWLPNEVVTCSVLSLRSFRHRAQSLVAAGSRTMNIAAAISSLLSSGSEQQVLRDALRLFRCVSCEDITEEILATNSPDKSLLKLSRLAHLGEVDAFMSHSWHDDPKAKWAALQEWRGAFKAEHGGREPVVWLDKVCIDQGSIDESLRCLPIFLSGCNQLLVFAGKTYLTRLWCIVEIFVFLTCGGKFENLTIRCTEGTNMTEDIMDFEASEVTCARPDDKDRLLAFVDAAFGDWYRFTAQVQRTVLKATREERPARRLTKRFMSERSCFRSP